MSVCVVGRSGIGWESLGKEHKVDKSRVWDQTKKCHIWRGGEERIPWRNLGGRIPLESERELFQATSYKNGAKWVWEMHGGMKKTVAPPSPDGVGEMNNLYLSNCRRSCSLLKGEPCLNLRQGAVHSEKCLRKQGVFPYYRRDLQRI